MKKVLALVLAVIMVCTMAMAVTVSTANPYGTNDPDTNAVRMNAITPGESLVFTSAELEAGDIEKASDYTVKITFAKGADLVASQGWVETSKGVFVYAVNTKTSTTAVQDDNADIVISSIVVTKTGVKNPVLETAFAKKVAGVVKYAYASNSYGTVMANADLTGFGWEKLDVDATEFGANKFAMAWDYGYTHADLTISADGLSIDPNPLTGGVIYTVKRTEQANAATKTYCYTAESGFVAGYELKVGEKLLFVNVGTLSTTGTAASNKLTKNLVDNDVTVKATLENVVVPNKAVTLTADGAKDGYKMYMVKADGSVVDLGAKFDDNKVLTATATLTGPVIVTDKALTASAGTTTGTTTNPGTGANDVVGVAAALAVVALVSGAAISLKK